MPVAPLRDFLGYRDGGMVFEDDTGKEQLFPVLPGTLDRAAGFEQVAGRDPTAVYKRGGGRGFGAPDDASGAELGAEPDAGPAPGEPMTVQPMAPAPEPPNNTGAAERAAQIEAAAPARPMRAGDARQVGMVLSPGVARALGMPGPAPMSPELAQQLGLPPPNDRQISPAVARSMGLDPDSLYQPVDPAMARDLASSREQQRLQLVAGDGGFAPPSADFFAKPAPPPRGAHAEPAQPADPRQFGAPPQGEFFAAGPPTPPPPPAPHAAPAPGPADRPFAPPTGAFAGGSPNAVVQPPTPLPARMPPTDRASLTSLPTPEQAADAAGKGGLTLQPTQAGQPAQPGDANKPAVKFSDKAAPKPAAGGGGGGAAAQPREMLAGRQVSIAGGPSPQTVAELEGIARREGDLTQRSLGRQIERDELARQQEDVIGGREKYLQGKVDEARQEQKHVLDDLSERRAAKLKEIEETKIDPANFWKDKSTLDKVATAFGLAFGAIGAAIQGHGGPNLAMQAFDNALNQHLDAQKANLAKKQHELSAMGEVYRQEKERTGDEIVARLEAKAAGLAQIREQARRLAAIPNNEDVALRAQQLMLDTDPKIANLHALSDSRLSEVKQYKTVVPGGGGGAAKKKPAGGVTLRSVGPGGKLVDKYVPFPSWMSDGQKSELLKRAQGANKAQQSLLDLQAKRGAGIPINDEDVQAFAQSFTYRYAEAEGQGQATADQEKSVSDKVRSSLGGGSRAIDSYQRSMDQVQEEILRQLTPPESE